MAFPSLFAKRGMPKRVGRELGYAPEDDIDEGMSPFRHRASYSDTIHCRLQPLTSFVDTGPLVRKPTSNLPRKKSKLRLSFNPAEAGSDDQRHTVSGNVSKKRPAASDRTQNLLRQSEASSQTIDRPSYSKDYLSELRNSTPTTPKNLSAYTSSAEDEAILDVTSKFGAHSSLSGASHIPSEAEIEEKKARRARLAQEQGSEDFIALESYDSDGEFKPSRRQVSTFLDDLSENASRLVRDDETIAEGFESFVDDPGKVTLSRRGRREEERKDKESMRNLIAEAEDSSEESDSSAERNHAYETAQTSHGMDGLSLKQQKNRRPQQPKEITPIPKLSALLARFREGVQGLEYESGRLQKAMADIREERLKVAEREEHIQQLLAKQGEEFERLREEAEARKAQDVDGDGRVSEDMEGVDAQAEHDREPQGLSD